MGDNVRILVIGVRGGTVKIGIEADPSINIRREELEDQPTQKPAPLPGRKFAKE